MSAVGFFVIFGKYVEESREQRKWTQGYLGERAGIPQTTISMIENAGGTERRKKKRGLRADKMIDPLLEALGVDVASACKRMAELAEQAIEARMDEMATGVSVEGNDVKITGREARAAQLIERELANEAEGSRPPRKSRSRTGELPAPPPPKHPGSPSQHRRTRRP